MKRKGCGHFDVLSSPPVCTQMKTGVSFTLGEEIMKFDSLLSFVPGVSCMPSSVVTIALNSRNMHNIQILIENLRAQVTVVEGLKTNQLLFRIVH